MKITHVTPYMHPHAGGPPVVVDRLCHRLSTRGWDVHVTTTDLMDDLSVPHWSNQLSGGYSMEILPLANMSAYIRRSRLSTAIEEQVRRSDLVHLHTLWTFPTYAAAHACRKWNVPFVVMPHGMLDPNSLRRKWLKKWLYLKIIELPMVRAARGMIYTHREEQRLATSAVGELPQGFIVPLGADEPPAMSRDDLAQHYVLRNPAARRRRRVIFLGRLHPKKGLDLLLPAFKKVISTQPDAELLLVGPGDRDYVESLRLQVAKLGLSNDVTFLGPLAGDAKWEALAASSVFVLPSYQENFALTVVEAMRLGVPIVLSRRVNIWDDVVRAQAGSACDLTASSVAEQLLWYLNNDQACKAAGIAGTRLVAERFNWESSADAIEAVYRQILPTMSRPCLT